MKEYQLTSRPYNRRDSGVDHSEVRVRISDSAPILGKNVTILQIRRRDYSTEWARSPHFAGIPLPYKEKLRFLLVTNTEVELIEQLAKLIPGTKARYFVPDFHRGKESWNLMLASMKEATKVSPPPVR